MPLQVEPYMRSELNFDRTWIEYIILNLADAFDIRVLWDSETACLSGVFAVAGGLVGGLAGGKMGAALGVGIGGAAGLGVSTVVSLRQIWDSVREKLKELLYIVFNYLRRLDARDYARAFDLLMACTSCRRELVFTILDIVGHRLGRQVFSSITHSMA